MRRFGVGVLVLASLLFTACSGHRIIVGVVLPETGVAKAYGPSLRAGIKLAFDEAAAKNSPKGVEAWYRDSISKPEYARKETDELFKSGALIIIGGATSDEAKAIIPAAENTQRIIISPSASEPGLAGSSNLFFRVYPSDEAEASVAASFLVTQKKANTILVLFQKGLYADGMLPVFTADVTKAGGKVLGQLPIGPTDWDKAITQALTTQKPDAVFICAYGEESLATLHVVRDAKYPGIVCASSAIYTGDVVKRAGAAADGVFVPMLKFDPSSQQEPTKSFVQAYRAANHGADPDIYAAHGYDAAMVALNALEGQPPKDTNELLQRIMSQGDKQGVTGKLAFDAAGNTTHRPRMHVIQSGKFVDCDPTPAT
jgi:branched-chain amino acid transport system substrate-binding protein